MEAYGEREIFFYPNEKKTRAIYRGGIARSISKNT